MKKIENSDFSILIVDDKPANLQILGNILQDERYKVEFAVNGIKALDWIERKEFDLVLLDVMMPEMDGFEVCRQLKKDPVKKDLPVILLTARDDTESIVEGFKSGAIDYVTKPFNKDELLVRIGTQLQLKVERDLNSRLLQEVILKNSLIIESINYAKRIQSAILPQPDIIKSYIPDHFILYMPKDIVSGDFYWFKPIDNKILLGVVDCTGHGIPGAIMSMLGYSGLTQAVNEYSLTEPADIIEHLHNYIKIIWQNNDDRLSPVDGMDVILISMDKENKSIDLSATNLSLFAVRGDKIIEWKGDRKEIGNLFYNKLDLTTTRIQLESGDLIYMSTDGYMDQFGGKKNKKIKTSGIKDLLLSIRSNPVLKHGEQLFSYIQEWMGQSEQTDDITVIGFQV